MSDEETSVEATPAAELTEGTIDPLRAFRVPDEVVAAWDAAREAARRARERTPVVVTPEERIAAHRKLLDEHPKAQARREDLEQELERTRLKLEEFERKTTVTAKDLLEQENARRSVKNLEREVAHAFVASSQLAYAVESTRAAHDDAREQLFGWDALVAFAERADSATDEEIAEKMREHDALFAHHQVGTFWSRQPKTLSPRERFRRGAAECEESTAKLRALADLRQRDEERSRLIWAQSSPVKRVELEQQLSGEQAADHAAFLKRFGERPTT